MNLQIVSLGLIEYNVAFRLQEILLELRQENAIDDILLLLEHPPVITMGKRGQTSHVHLTQQQLKALGASLVTTNRGGDVTYHGPGQIVGYPIMDLKLHGKSVRKFIFNIEEVFIQLLKDYSIEAVRDPQYTGVWVGNDKITAIGFAIKRWVSMHGFALNVNTNLTHFNWITPCGITDRGTTSLEKLLGQKQDLKAVMLKLSQKFCEVFDSIPQWLTVDELASLFKEKGVTDQCISENLVG